MILVFVEVKWAIPFNERTGAIPFNDHTGGYSI